MRRIASLTVIASLAGGTLATDASAASLKGRKLSGAQAKANISDEMNFFFEDYSFERRILVFARAAEKRGRAEAVRKTAR